MCNFINSRYFFCYMRIKGYEIKLPNITDSHSRRAEKFKNTIVSNLKKIGVIADDVDIDMPRVAIKKMPASVFWYLAGHQMYYAFSRCDKYVENLAVVSQVIANEVAEVLSGEKDIPQFCRDFSETEDVSEERLHAREVLGLASDEMDWSVIDKAYKKMSMKAHPDMENGSHELFLEINNAHKVLRRELQ